MMTLACSSITVLLLLVIQYHPATSQIHYVSPPDQLVQCISLNITCHELSFYAQNSELFFTNDTVFFFLSGKHRLNQSVLITAVVNLTLIGLGEREIGFHETVMQSTVIIECDNSVGGFIFLDVIDLTLEGLTITECNSLPLAMVESQDLLLFFEYLVEIGSVLEEIGIFNASMFLLQVSNVNLLEMSIQNATQVGLLGINVYNSTIDSSSFSVNNFNWVQDCIIRDGICEGGNLIIGYTYSWPNYCYGIDTVFTLDIVNSNFSLAVSTYISKAIPGGGISIFVDNFDRYSAQVRMKNVIAYNNTAYPGGNINIATSATSSLYSFIMEGVSSMFGNEMSEKLRETNKNLTLVNYGGGLMVSIGITPRLSLALIGNCSSTLITSPQYIITISSSSLNENFGLIGAGLYISVQSFARSSILQYIVLTNNDFSNNYGYIGIGMYIDQKSFPTFAASLEYDLININVTNSKIKVPPNITSNGTAIQMEGLQRVNVFDILVADNSPVQGAILSSTNWLVNGFNNVFRNNSALSGGAMSLLLNSVIALVPPAKIYFINNTATVDGGAIFVINGPSLFPYCFFQIQSSESTLNPIAEWHFINNTARFSGDSIYGANIEKCYLFESSTVSMTNSSLSIFRNTFFFNDQPIKSAISSDPNRVCFCSNITQNCETTELNMEAFPGSYITLSLSTVGIFESFSKGIVRIQEYLVINGTEINVVTQNLPFFDADSCSNYFYQIKSNASYNLSLSLSVTPPLVNIVDSFVTYPSIYISVKVLTCPPGFSIGESDTCACNEILIQTANSNITCNISNQSITRNGDVWIGYVNSTECLLVHNNCPYEYCNTEYTTFTVYSPDPQCALMRSGILCGECAQGYSLLIGSNGCGQCSNNYISLLVVFAVAGVVLVVFLLALNLTVSIGTINGLIFVTNVIKIYETAFFTGRSVPVLSQFISWINLDFGIEVCFYNGLDAVAKSWLQFIFPVYIWILILVVILISRYSTRFSRLIGQNILPVFATLILLSYTKLFRVIVPILQFTRMKCNITGESHYFWSLDGNVPYNSFTHIALVVFALAVFLVLISPFTLLLIFDVLLISRVKSTPFYCTKILLRLKPLFDAFYGPYKNNCYIWTGILLVARLLLVVTASISTIEVYRTVSISTISILLATMVYLEGIYTNKWNNIIECFFLLTLSIVIASVQYSSYATDVGVVLMMCAFLGICAYQVIKIYCLPRFRSRKREENLLASVVENSGELDIPTMISRSVVEISPKPKNRRETLLLESDDEDNMIPYNQLYNN